MGLAARQIYPDARAAPRLELSRDCSSRLSDSAEVPDAAITENRKELPQRSFLEAPLLGLPRDRNNSALSRLRAAQLTPAECSLNVLLILPVEGRHPDGS